MAFVGMPPIGCLPAVITLYSGNAFLQRGCIEELSSVAREYNSKLQTMLDLMNQKSAHLGGKMLYIDIYGPLTNIIHKSDKYGMSNIIKAHDML